MGPVLLIGRIVFGGYFLYSGLMHFIMMKQMSAYAAQHGVPGVMVAFSGALIVLGGLHVLLGLMPRFGLFLILCFLIPVTAIMHPFWAETGEAAMHDIVNFTKNVALMGGALGFMALPVPWPYSVDEALEHRGYGPPIPH